MGNYKFLYPQGKEKALTLSYDDGVQFDKRLVGILNKYNIKATFNVNSGIEAGTGWINNGVNITRMKLEDTLDLYKGHEIAIHTLSHPSLVELNREQIINEVLQDKINLEKIYDTVIRGMSYPFGTYNEEVVDVIKNCGVDYSRTVVENEDFTLPKNFLEWHSTCRHANPRLMELAKEFLEKDDGELDLFYLWGHSYEFEVNNNWHVIEEFSKLISNKNDIWYATNIEIYDYITAVRTLKYSGNKNTIYNSSAITVWVSFNNKVLKIEAGKTILIN